ncbi:RagB/SusD family nutrient uptake outer membrane protein [Chitinophaga jiangningensis]|nr:RagB/SusD family nutrient uptake outer membrane protein [Chitinophaga jiangningensis]
MNFNIKPIYALCLGICLSGCKKLIEIDAPINTVGTEIVFATDQKAKDALNAAYALMFTEDRTNIGALNGGLTVAGGLLSDEMELTFGTQLADMYPYYTSKMLKEDGLSALYWIKPYRVIYTVNSVLEGLASSSTISDSTRKRLTGEAKMLRAFSYFNLVNCFGDVPLVTITDVNKNMSLGRSPVANIYQQMEADLKEAVALLPDNYKATGNNKAQPNKYAAAALLARVYLYQEKWADARAMADVVINSGNYALTTPNKTFEANSNEALWQLQGATVYMDQLPETRYVTPAAILALQPDMEEMYTDMSIWPDVMQLVLPQLKLSTAMVNAFEPGDERKLYWTNRTLTPVEEPYNKVPVWYAYKYMISDAVTGTPGNLNLMVLRLAEVYLIRAEALAQEGKVAEAAADLDVIRSRAGLSNTTAATKQDLLNAILKERQVELFGEWAHRWFDLKRTHKATAVLSALPYKQPWSDHTLLMPVPMSEITSNPKLAPNPGY